MSEELALCPFCGGDAKAHTYKDDFEATRFSVECVRCPAEMGWLVDAQPWGENLATKRAETIAAWNRRAPSPSILEGVAELIMLRILALDISPVSAKKEFAIEELQFVLGRIRSLTGAKP